MNCPKCGSKLDTGYNCTKCDYRYIKIEDAKHAPQEPHIFDKFGNYLFPTDIKMESPNDACGTIMTVKFGTKEEVKEDEENEKTILS